MAEYNVLCDVWPRLPVVFLVVDLVWHLPVHAGDTDLCDRAVNFSNTLAVCLSGEMLFKSFTMDLIVVNTFDFIVVPVPACLPTVCACFPVSVWIIVIRFIKVASFIVGPFEVFIAWGDFCGPTVFFSLVSTVDDPDSAVFDLFMMVVGAGFVSVLTASVLNVMSGLVLVVASIFRCDFWS